MSASAESALREPAWLSNANSALFLKRAGATLDVALQPIVDVHTGRTLAFESLARHHDRMGFDTPASLFAHADKQGVLLQLECLLLAKALAKYADARKLGWAMLFVNLDGRLLGRSAEIEAHLGRLTRVHGLEPSDICIELSESNQILPHEEFEREVTRLRAAGLSVAIDDFGTGTSGLQMLYQVSPDFLKVDRFFIRSLQSDPKKRLMVSAIVDVAHTLGIRVIAEGIETPAELLACRDIRCDLAQGYLVARPAIEVSSLKSNSAAAHAVSDRRRQGLDAGQIRPLLQTLECLPTTATLTQVFEIFERSPAQTVIPVVDGGLMPKGVIRERDLKSYVYSRFGRDLLRNTSLGFKLADFIRPIPVADVNSQLAPLLQLVAVQPEDGILMTEGMRYCGMLPAPALVSLANDIRMHEAASRNPLSGLPANQAIRTYLDEAGERSDVRRIVCYIDLDNFKPFNDKYGFRLGDRALLLLADILKSLQTFGDIFVGHVGGDDFFVGASGEICSRVVPMIEKAQLEFKSSAESLYSPEDRQAGKITCKARDGRIESFPLLTCTVAVLELEPYASPSGGEALAARLAQVKVNAKAVKGSLVHAVLGKEVDPEIEVAA